MMIYRDIYHVFYWLPAVQSIDQKPGLKIIVNQIGYEIILARGVGFSCLLPNEWTVTYLALIHSLIFNNSIFIGDR